MALVVLKMLKVARRVLMLLLKGPFLPVDGYNKFDYGVQSQFSSYGYWVSEFCPSSSITNNTEFLEFDLLLLR
jgi:hypothetical protein